MFDLSLNDRLFLSFSVALGFIVAGTGNALLGPRSGWLRAGLGALGLGATLISADAFVPDRFSALAAIGAGGLLILVVVQTGFARRWAAVTGAQLRKPRLAWGLVACGGFALLCGEFLRFDLAQQADFDEQERTLQAQGQPSPYVADETRLAKTDQGSAIHLLTSGESPSADELNTTEQITLQSAHVADYVIRRGPADDTSNCHGWVFTGGKFAIRSAEVETILIDNDYEVVPTPRSGDLCVYRTGGDTVSHTAVVRSVLDDGTVLVEGKWGRYGVFLHPVDRSVYGINFAYYRADRTGHVLNSIP